MSGRRRLRGYTLRSHQIRAWSRLPPASTTLDARLTPWMRRHRRSASFRFPPKAIPASSTVGVLTRHAPAVAGGSPFKRKK